VKLPFFANFRVSTLFAKETRNMKHTLLESKAGRFFWSVTAYPKTILTLALLVVLAAAAYLPQITKDTSSDAFIPVDHPALVYRDQVKEIFGLADPVVVAVINDGPRGIFNPKSLQLITWLTDEISKVPGVDPDRVTSLATENDIVGTDDGMLVEPFFEYPPEKQEQADAIREAVMDFPLYLGSLVAEDGSATLIVAELLDEEHGGDVYEALLALADKAPRNGEQIHVAGEGAVREYLGSYIDSDAQRLNPVAAIVISVILFIAYRTLRGVLLPNLVVLGAVAIALGTMAAVGIPFYVITNALPVILISIGVADGIHILAQYYEDMVTHPQASSRELTVLAMTEMWRPVTVTSLTDIAGFMGLSLASYMPPMKAFGIFASLGVLAALLLSLFVLPSILVLLKPKASKVFGSGSSSHVDKFARSMAWLGNGVTRRPGWILAGASVVALVGMIGAFRLEMNEARIDNFKHSEPIYRADQAINRVLDGTNYLDIVIATPEPEDLFNPEHLRRIEAMQEYLETLPHVKGTTSVVDYLKQINRALHEDKLDSYELPADAELVAQYFLLYSASGDPTDFEEEIDYDYQLANLRVTLDTGLFTDERVVVEAAQRYIDEHFNRAGISANLSGRVNLDYHWLRDLAGSHFRGLAVALVLVWLMGSLSFRSAVAGALAVVPVLMAVLLIYAVMGFFGVWLGLGTSMFAAIAIGISVDFAVHTLDRLMALVRDGKQSLEEAFATLFLSNGRALLFNFSCVLLGFGVLTTSSVPPLIRFGSLVGVAVTVSFLASQTVLPALVKVLRPKFLGLSRNPAVRSDRSAEHLPVAA